MRRSIQNEMTICKNTQFFNSIFSDLRLAYVEVISNQ